MSDWPYLRERLAGSWARPGTDDAVLVGVYDGLDTADRSLPVIQPEHVP
jgi:hypothetical protein